MEFQYKSISFPDNWNKIKLAGFSVHLAPWLRPARWLCSTLRRGCDPHANSWFLGLIVHVQPPCTFVVDVIVANINIIDCISPAILILCVFLLQIAISWIVFPLQFENFAVQFSLSLILIHKSRETKLTHFHTI